MASKFSWDSEKKPILALAPMEGYTDSAFRQLVKKYTPGVICFTEFTSADALKYNSKVSFKKITFAKTEKPLIVQLFGKKPEHFIEAAKLVEESGAAGIDINMGCPAKKVIGSLHGSALLKDPELAAEIVHTVVKNTNLPVSVKTRIGFNSYDEEKLQSFCLKIQDAGAKLMTIHGRTKKQGYGGKADWDPIYKIKEKLNIHVIGNGDVDSPEAAVKKLKNLDGVMVGRATFGNPLIMYHIYNELHPGNESDKKLPDWHELAKNHIELAVESKGERHAMLEMRKHLAVYVKGFPGAANYRSRLVRVETKNEAFELLDEIKENSPL
ncbi:tRNA dihydrouridine synthase DusB [Patescibacteria group bacterium]